MRIDNNTQRGAAVTIIVDDSPIVAYLGETVAGALLANGRRSWRQTENGQPRGYFCGMGVCFDCTVTVNGVRYVRACLEPVADGMVVRTERGSEG